MSDVMTIYSGTLKSMEVADMVEKEHSKLLRDIRRYIKQLGEAKIGFSDFFQESTYISEQNKVMPCFDITRKGCEFIAHKMTGPKGTVFTARYVNRFHEMERELTDKEAPLLDSKKAYLIDRLMIDTSDRPKVPLIENWYERNIGRVERICKIMKIPKKTLYHILLKRLGEKYDLEAAKGIYMETVGLEPKYAMEIVSFFPELGEMADGLLDRMEKNIYH